MKKYLLLTIPVLGFGRYYITATSTPLSLIETIEQRGSMNKDTTLLYSGHISITFHPDSIQKTKILSLGSIESNGSGKIVFTSGGNSIYQGNHQTTIASGNVLLTTSGSAYIYPSSGKTFVHIDTISTTASKDLYNQIYLLTQRANLYKGKYVSLDTSRNSNVYMHTILKHCKQEQGSKVLVCSDNPTVDSNYSFTLTPLDIQSRSHIYMLSGSYIRENVASSTLQATINFLPTLPVAGQQPEQFITRDFVLQSLRGE